MQVNPLAAAPSGPAAAAGALLWPTLLNLTTLSPQAEALRAQREEDDERRSEGAAGLAAGPGGPPGTVHAATEAMLQAERRVAPGSRAARREADEVWQRRQTQRQEAFRRTLRDASAWERQAARAPEGRPARAAAEPTPGGTEESPPRDAANRSRGRGESVRGPASSATGRASAPGPAAPHAAGTPEAPPTHGPRRTVEAPPGQAAPQTPAPVGSAVAPGAVRGAVPAVGTTPASAAPASAAGARSTVASVTAPATQSGPAAKPSVRRHRAAPTTETGKPDANVRRILRVIHSQIGRDRARATLRLDPPELGTVRLRMDLRKEALTLRIETQTPLAHRLLTEHVESLRQGLEAAGLRLEHVEIRPPAANPNAGHPDPTAHDAGGRAGQERPADPETEHPAHQGTDARAGEPHEPPARSTQVEPAAESLVNILA